MPTDSIRHIETLLPTATVIGALGTIANTDTNKYTTLGGEPNTSAYGGSTLGAQSNTVDYP